MEWYSKDTTSDQGLVIDAETGKTIAVSYDPKNAPLLAAAPDMLEALENTLWFLDRVADRTFDREDVRRQQDYIRSVVEGAKDGS